MKHIQPRKPPKTDAPAPGWSAGWHGLYYRPEMTYYNHAELERQAFLNILTCYPDQAITLFELGAGRGDWCMAATGVVRHKLIEPCPSQVTCYAVEADPTHAAWTRDHFMQNSVVGQVIEAAVSNVTGTVPFRADLDPLASFAQRIMPAHDGDTIRVPCYRMNDLASQLEVTAIDILHMDVQGEETKVVQGMGGLLPRTSYFVIETHSRVLEAELTALLWETHDQLVYLPIGGTLALDGFDRPFVGKGGGVQVWQLRALRDDSYTWPASFIQEEIAVVL